MGDGGGGGVGRGRAGGEGRRRRERAGSDRAGGWGRSVSDRERQSEAKRAHCCHWSAHTHTHTHTPQTHTHTHKHRTSRVFFISGILPLRLALLAASRISMNLYLEYRSCTAPHVTPGHARCAGRGPSARNRGMACLRASNDGARSRATCCFASACSWLVFVTARCSSTFEMNSAAGILLRACAGGSRP